MRQMSFDKLLQLAKFVMIVTMIMLMTMTMIIMKMTPMPVIMMRLRKKVVTAMQLLSSGKE